MIGIILLSLLAIQTSSQIDPPLWPNHFSQTFVQSYKQHKTHTSGQIHYDYERQMQRVDRMNGKQDLICGSIQPNITTTCTHLVRDNKRYIIFPQKRICCMCCDASHGCGIQKKDWLKGASYQGNQTLQGQNFYKWSIQDNTSTDYYWETKSDKRIPRRLSEMNLVYQDFIMNSYSQEQIPDHIFNLPSYCNSTCSPATQCGKFQTFKNVNEMIL